MWQFLISTITAGPFNILTELREVVAEWKFLGFALDVPNSKIKEIEVNHPNDVKKCLEKVIEAWLQMQKKASWETLCDALRTDLVNCHAIAKQIEEKYLL